MAYISRDPFARTELHRRRMPVSSATSRAWCGQTRSTKRGARFLYRYSIESDGGRKSDLTGLFCSIGCMRDYHN